MSNQKSPLLNRKEAAQYLHVSTSSLDRLTRRKELPRRVIGTNVLYLRDDLDAFIESCYRIGFMKSPFG
jgi:excisionase family DNA binding protein